MTKTLRHTRLAAAYLAARRRAEGTTGTTRRAALARVEHLGDRLEQARRVVALADLPV